MDVDENKPVIRRGQPIMPMRNTSRVSVYKGEVYVGPVGYICLGPDAEGRLWASDGNKVVQMTSIGTVLDE